MNRKLTNYLVATIWWICLIFNGGSRFILAQSLDNQLNEAKPFGHSLKKNDKQKKDKAITKKNDQAGQDLVPVNDEVIQVETILILDEVLVFDAHGNQVKGLKKEDFIVKEDGESQEISTFLPGDSELIPRSIVLIIDYSGSQLPYIETSVNAAKILVDKLNPNDRMAIVTDKVEVLQEFTNDKNLLKDKLEGLKINALSGQVGPSRQYSALLATLNEMFDDKSLRPIIIFQTDGDELAFTKDFLDNSLFQTPEGRRFSYRDILTATEKTRATIYTIIPGLNFNGISKQEKVSRSKRDIENGARSLAKINNSPFNPNIIKLSNQSLLNRAQWLGRQQEAIAELARLSGGVTTYLEKPEQAGQIYAEILFRMNLRYVIGYYPTNQERSGKTRKVKIEVPGHPEYKIVSRETYILPEVEKR